MGAEAKLKAGGRRATKKASPPAGYNGGKVNRHRKGQAPPGAWFAPFPSAARVQSQGSCTARSISAAGGLMPGMQGAKPLA